MATVLARIPRPSVRPVLVPDVYVLSHPGIKRFVGKRTRRNAKDSFNKLAVRRRQLNIVQLKKGV